MTEPQPRDMQAVAQVNSCLFAFSMDSFNEIKVNHGSECSAMLWNGNGQSYRASHTNYRQSEMALPPQRRLSDASEDEAGAKAGEIANHYARDLAAQYIQRIYRSYRARKYMSKLGIMANYDERIKNVYAKMAVPRTPMASLNPFLFR